MWQTPGTPAAAVPSPTPPGSREASRAQARAQVEAGLGLLQHSSKTQSLGSAGRPLSGPLLSPHAPWGQARASAASLPGRPGAPRVTRGPACSQLSCCPVVWGGQAGGSRAWPALVSGPPGAGQGLAVRLETPRPSSFLGPSLAGPHLGCGPGSCPLLSLLPCTPAPQGSSHKEGVRRGPPEPLHARGAEADGGHRSASHSAGARADDHPASADRAHLRPRDKGHSRKRGRAGPPDSLRLTSALRLREPPAPPALGPVVSTQWAGPGGPGTGW